MGVGAVVVFIWWWSLGNAFTQICAKNNLNFKFGLTGRLMRGYLPKKPGFDNGEGESR